MFESNRIFYKKGFKYQLTSNAFFNVACKPIENITTPFIDLDTEGELTIRAGYAWDGPSGPTIDTKNFMRGSLVHDALYQLMRQQLISIDEKEHADLELQRISITDGMSRIRAWWVKRGLFRFGKAATLPKNAKDTLVAPY